jgi:preprotein translocase subunit SecG
MLKIGGSEFMEIVFGIILLITAVFLIIAVLMQSGKSHNLSGAIAGGAETFFGKAKGKTIDKMLSKLTTIVAIFFALLVIIVYVIQPDTAIDFDKWLDDYLKDSETTAAVDTTAEAETTAALADTTAAQSEPDLGIEP